MERKIRVLNYGFVEVQDVSGADFLARHISGLISFRFLIKCPKFIALDSFYSKGLGKFSELIVDSSNEEYYIPSNFTSSFTGLKFTEEEQNILHTKVQNLATANSNFLKKLELRGVSPSELDCLKLQTIYTQFYWMVTVEEILVWFRVALKDSCLKEKQEYVQAVLELFGEKLPHTAEEFLRREFPELIK